MAHALKVVNNPEDGIGYSVRLREEALGDNRHAHVAYLYKTTVTKQWNLHKPDKNSWKRMSDSRTGPPRSPGPAWAHRAVAEDAVVGLDRTMLAGMSVDRQTDRGRCFGPRVEQWSAP